MLKEICVSLVRKAKKEYFDTLDHKKIMIIKLSGRLKRLVLKLNE